MTEFLLLAALMGPPAPRAQTQLVPAYEARLEEIKRVADGTLTDAGIMGAAGAFDVWATDHCITSNPKCYELNPGGRTGTQRIALKAGFFPVKVGGVYLLRRLGKHNLARGTAIAVAAVDMYLGIRALNRSTP